MAKGLQRLHRQDTEPSERKIMATTRITYTDGTSELVPITMRATCKAEAHAIDAGWGPITQSPSVPARTRPTRPCAWPAAACLISSIGWTPWRPSTLRQRRRSRKRETLRTSRVASRLARPSLIPPGKPFRRHAMAMEERGRRAGLGHRTGRTAQGSGRNTEGVNRGAQRDHERAHHRQRR